MDKKVATPEEMEKLKSITAHLRLFKGTGSDMIDIEGHAHDIAKVMSVAMDRNPDFYEAVKMAMTRYEMMQNPLGRLVLLMKDASECECDKCRSRREKADRAAKEN